MTGAPLFSGPLLDATAAAPAASAPAPADQSFTGSDGVAMPKAIVKIGTPMFSGPLATDQPAPPPAADGSAAPVDDGSTNPEQVVAQGESGVNEGIAGLLSAPTNLLHGALALGPDMSNAIFGTKFSDDTSYLPDAGKTYLQMAGDMGAEPRAPTSAPADQIARIVGQNVGGALIPEIGLEGDIAKGVMPAAGAVAKGLLPAASAGLAGAAAQQIAPGNPVAQLGAELIGGVVPSTALASARAIGGMGAELPTLEQLTAPDHNAGLVATKNAAYDAADKVGARYSAQGFGDLTAKMAADATADGINPMRHPQASGMLQQMDVLQAQGYAPSLTQLDQLRQVISRDVAKSSDAAEAHFGRQMISNIDDFIANATPAQMAAGSGPDAAAAIQGARAANTTLSKTNAIDTAIQKATANAGAAGSGGNINNALRQQFKPFLSDPSKARGLTPDETQAIVKIVMGGPVENTLRLVGKMAPGGNGLMNQMSTASAVLSHGATLPIPLAGAVAKRLADGMTESKIANLRAAVSGSPTPKASFYTPGQDRALSSMGAAAATNPTIEDQIKAAVMRRAAAQ